MKNAVAEAFWLRVMDAAKAIRLTDRKPAAVRISRKTARFLIWCLAEETGTPLRDLGPFDRLLINEYPAEISDDIPDLQFGWVIGHNDKPDQFGPGGAKGE